MKVLVWKTEYEHEILKSSFRSILLKYVLTHSSLTHFLSFDKVLGTCVPWRFNQSVGPGVFPPQRRGWRLLVGVQNHLATVSEGLAVEPHACVNRMR